MYFCGVRPSMLPVCHAGCIGIVYCVYSVWVYGIGPLWKMRSSNSRDANESGGRDSVADEEVDDDSDEDAG